MLSHTCPCGTEKPYQQCCGLFIEQSVVPDTAEQLMRSRYTAYTQANIDYIVNTMCGPALEDFNVEQAKQWASQLVWQKLLVLITEQKQTDSSSVTFIACYSEQNQPQMLGEISQFIYQQQRWFYHSGEPLKLHRNADCACGSGQKFKRCCLKLVN